MMKFPLMISSQEEMSAILTDLSKYLVYNLVAQYGTIPDDGIVDAVGSALGCAVALHQTRQSEVTKQ